METPMVLSNCVQGNGVREDLIFDVGLHKGEDAAYYLKKGFRVVGIDANPDLIEWNRKRFAGNERITIIFGAIAQGQGNVRFFVDRQSTWGTVDPNWARRNVRLGSGHHEIEVPIFDIREAFERWGVPYYLKLDIEGREDVIIDVLGELSSRPAFISMESEKVDFRKLIQELRKLRNLGYQRFQVVPQVYIPNSSIRTRDRNGSVFDYVFEDDASGAFGDDLTGRWISFSEASARYAFIFIQYKLFGDDGLMFRLRGGKFIHRLLMACFGAFPGWYDTHAKL
jgi:FkbM family methyltransferase